MEFFCGGYQVSNNEVVSGLPERSLQVVRRFSASLCEVTVDGEFPADPREFIPLEKLDVWPSVDHCIDSKKDRN